jgi:hypothetical protein
MESWPATLDLLRRLYTTAEPIEAVAWDLPSFLAAYTLHDSALAEVRLEQSDGLLVLIQWDMHWNKRVASQYQNLVIGIPMVYSVQWSQGGWNQNTLSGAASERVSAEERRQMLEDGSVELRAYQNARDEVPPPFEDEGLTRTTFESMNWSRLTVLHGGDVRFLCLDDEGRAGRIPRGDGG